MLWHRHTYSMRFSRRQSNILLLAAPVIIAAWLLLFDHAATRASGGDGAHATSQADQCEEHSSTTDEQGKVEHKIGDTYQQQLPGSDLFIEMTYIPGGTFLMGSPANEDGREKNEGPQIEVEVEPFWMATYEITWDQWKEFSKWTAILQTDRPPAVPRDQLADAVTYPSLIWQQETGPVLTRMGENGGYPAIYMSHLAARQFTKWLSLDSGRFYRLPTEAEWEYACRAGATTAYWFGDDPDDLADHDLYLDNSELDDGDPAYRKVGFGRPNPWGLYNMHGNVAEWVLDQYDAELYAKFAGRKVTWREVLQWPETRYPCVMRGGHYDAFPEESRAAYRRFSGENDNIGHPSIPRTVWYLTENDKVGFRIVCPVTEPPTEEKLKYWNNFDPKIEEIIRHDDRIFTVLIEDPKEKDSPSKE